MSGLSIESLAFDVEGLTEETLDEPGVRLWRSPQQCITKLYFFPTRPPWSFDILSTEGCAKVAAEHYVTHPLAIGAGAAGNCEVSYWLAKLAPEGWRGRLYVATILVPFEEAYFRIDAAAREQGTTGLRESTVVALHHQNAAFPESPDDEFWDTAFTEHPLTLVRARLRTLLRTLKLNVDGERPAPFRVV